MADHAGNQIQRATTHGQQPGSHQDNLHQILAEGRPGPDTRFDSRSKSMYKTSNRGTVLTNLKRPEKNETSLAIVPRNHPLLPLPQLEAEGAGYLDRLLSVFQDPSMYV
jgi:hypothetical protein